MSDETPALPTYRDEDGIAVITLDDGKANAIGNAVLEVLEQQLDQAESDQVRGLVIVGREGRFSAGFDLKEMTASVDGMRALVERGARWWMRLYGLGMPTVAACTGHALAGGALTLLSCDVRIGADIPAKIGLTEVSIGMALPQFAVELARDRLTGSALGAATIQGTAYDAAGAVEVGYLDRVVPADSVIAEAMAECRRLAELRTGAYAHTKQNLRRDMIAACLAGVHDDMAAMDGPTP